MNKKFAIFILIVILLLILGGVFYWRYGSDYVFEGGRVNSKYYIVKNTSNGQIIENKKEGFQITVPNDWIVRKEFDVVAFYSPDIQFNQNGALVLQSIKDGACGVGIEIIKYKSGPGSTSYSDYIKILIDAIKAGEYKEDTPKNEVILINNKEGLLTTYTKEEKIISITLEIPVNNTLYSFDSGIIFNEKCVDEFYKIIETGLIAK